MRRLTLGSIAAVAIGTVAAIAIAQKPFPPVQIVPMPAAEAARHTAWDFRLTAIDGEPMPMTKYKGKVVMLVNTATQCGFKAQLSSLQKVQDDYAKRGFTVVAVPSGNFRGQELADNKAIADTCSSLFGVRYPMAEKADVIGPGAIPIFKWAAARLGPGQAPQWNFHKYLIGKDGKLIQAFGTRTEPTAPEVRAAIEKALRA